MKTISNELYARLEYLGLIDESGVRNHNAGTSDYKDFLIQPWAIWLDHHLDCWEGDIIKRILRHKKGDSRRLDFEKIKHICDEKIRQIDIEEKNGKTDFNSGDNRGGWSCISASCGETAS